MREIMSNERVCVVKLIDDHGVVHKVKVRAGSVYEAALLGLSRLERVGWESDGSQVSRVMVEVWEEPTRHSIDVKKLLSWLSGYNDQELNRLYSFCRDLNVELSRFYHTRPFPLLSCAYLDFK
jgi:hypothetical protein